MNVQLGIKFVDTFDGTKCMYSVPNRVKGVVIVKVLKRPIHVKSLTISFTGILKMSFTKGKYDSDSGNTEIYRTRGTLTNQVIVASHSSQPGGTVTLDVGDHFSPFSFKTTGDGRTLYSSSCDGANKIDYNILVRLNATRFTDTASTTKQVILQNLAFISKLPAFDRQSKASRAEKSLGCFSCLGSSSNISLLGRIAKGAYRPGENIAVEFEVSNYSPKALTPKVTLMKVRHLTIAGAEQYRYRLVSYLEATDTIPPMTGQSSTTVQLPLPKTMHPGTVLDIPCLKITYYLKVELCIPWSCNLSVKLPVIIGQ